MQFLVNIKLNVVRICDSFNDQFTLTNGHKSNMRIGYIP
jgi:hypothetical protein